MWETNNPQILRLIIRRFCGLLAAREEKDAKKDEATEVAPNLMFSQRNNPYCELLHNLCCKNR